MKMELSKNIIECAREVDDILYTGKIVTKCHDDER